MGIFNRLDRMVSRTVDRMHSVQAVVDGMIQSPNGRPQPDPERSEIIIRGVFDQADEYQQIESRNRDRKGNDFRTLMSGMDYQFSVDAVRYPAAREIKQGDRLTLDDTRRFDILSVQPDGLSRINFRLLAA